MISRYITEDVTEKVVTLLDEFASGQLGSDLSWAHLEKAFGYTRQALSANKIIKEKFTEAKASLKAHKRKVSTSISNEADRDRLKQENDALKERIEEYEKRFIRWIHNCHKRGINPIELDAPMGMSPKTALRSMDR